MSLETAWKQNILVIDSNLLKLLLVVLGFGSQTFICGFSRQNICSVGHVVSNLYGTEFEIWACFGLVGNTEKNWADYEGKEKLDISLKINCDF